MIRRELLYLAGAITIAPSAFANEIVEVYKIATCGCCTQWGEHLRAAGFSVRAHDVADPGTYRRRFGIPENLGSCHTARVAGYSIEGHVPAREIRRLLKARPDATGLAVPAMPLGSPGMEGPRSDPYEVLLFHKDGQTRVFARYP